MHPSYALFVGRGLWACGIIAQSFFKDDGFRKVTANDDRFSHTTKHTAFRVFLRSYIKGRVYKNRTATVYALKANVGKCIPTGSIVSKKALSTTVPSNIFVSAIY